MNNLILLLGIIFTTLLFSKTNAQASLWVQLENGGSGADLAFSTSGLGASGFSLDDDADPTLSNNEFISGPGAFVSGATITMTSDPGNLVEISCIYFDVTNAERNVVYDLGTRTVTFDLDVTDRLICKFITGASPPSFPTGFINLDVRVKVLPGGNTGIQFAVFSSALSPTSAILDDNPGTSTPDYWQWKNIDPSLSGTMFLLVPNGIYTISCECVSSAISSSIACGGAKSINLIGGGVSQTAICTFLFEPPGGQPTPFPVTLNPGFIVFQLQNRGAALLNTGNVVLSAPGLQGSPIELDDPTTQDADTASNTFTVQKAPGTYAVEITSAPLTATFDSVCSLDANDASTFTATTASLELNDSETLYVRIVME